MNRFSNVADPQQGVFVAMGLLIADQQEAISLSPGELEDARLLLRNWSGPLRLKAAAAVLRDAQGRAGAVFARDEIPAAAKSLDLAFEEHARVEALIKGDPA